MKLENFSATVTLIFLKWVVWGLLREGGFLKRNWFQNVPKPDKIVDSSEFILIKDNLWSMTNISSINFKYVVKIVISSLLLFMGECRIPLQKNYNDCEGGKDNSIWMPTRMTAAEILVMSIMIIYVKSQFVHCNTRKTSNFNF